MTQGTCSIDGCGTTGRVIRTWCNKHYLRWQRHGDPLFVQVIRGDDEARFWSYADRRADDECWPWTGHLDGDGYALFFGNGRQGRAHRWAYEYFVGPIPDGLVIDHVRDNGCTRKDCVNWARHLEPVTNRENILRGDGLAAINVRKTHCPQGHPYDKENTYRNKGRRICRACGRERARMKKAA